MRIRSHFPETRPTPAKGRLPSLTWLTLAASSFLGLGLMSPGMLMADDGHERTKKHLEKIEDAQKELAEVRARLDKALAAYGDTVREGADERRDSYKALVKWIDRCEERADDLDDRREKMDDEAKKYFEKWKKSTKDIKDKRLKTGSEDRIAETRSRYKELSDYWRAATKDFHPLLERLKDQAQFLGHDLNEQSVAELRKDDTTLDGLVSAYERSTAEFERVAEDYRQSLAVH